MWNIKNLNNWNEPSSSASNGGRKEVKEKKISNDDQCSYQNMGGNTTEHARQLKDDGVGSNSIYVRDKNQLLVKKVIEQPNHGNGQQNHKFTNLHSKDQSLLIEKLNHIEQNILNHKLTTEYFKVESIHQSVHKNVKRFRESVYYGELRQNIRSGLGIMIYANGRLYEGEWVDNSKEGKGYERFSNGSIYKGAYVKGKPDGYGRYQWENGQVYEGEWVGGLKDGSGIWRGSKGDSYIGQWKEGKADGYGVHTWINGDRYQGEFRNCLKHGEGVEKFANGDSYKGNYQHGKPSGFGEYYWGIGSFFKGNFKNGLRNGQGVWKRGPGHSDKYEGEYKDDKKEGEGSFSWADGNLYKGFYKNDVRQGYGEMYWSDGGVFKGQWKEGSQILESQIISHEDLNIPTDDEYQKTEESLLFQNQEDSDQYIQQYNNIHVTQSKNKDPPKQSSKEIKRNKHLREMQQLQHKQMQDIQQQYQKLHSSSKHQQSLLEYHQPSRPALYQENQEHSVIQRKHKNSRENVYYRSQIRSERKDRSPYIPLESNGSPQKYKLQKKYSVGTVGGKQKTVQNCNNLKERKSMSTSFFLYKIQKNAVSKQHFNRDNYSSNEHHHATCKNMHYMSEISNKGQYEPVYSQEQKERQQEERHLANCRLIKTSGGNRARNAQKNNQYQMEEELKYFTRSKMNNPQDFN